MISELTNAVRNHGKGIRCGTLCVLVSMMLTAGSVLAQSDDTKKKSQSTDSESSSPSDDALDEALLKQLLGPQADSDKDDNPLQNAIRRMREAQKRIDGKDTGAETQTLQKGVVDDLDKLIKLAERLQSRSDSPPSRNKPQPKPNKTNPKETPGKKNKSKGSKTEDTGKRKQKGKAAKSTEKSEKGDAGDVELARRERLVKDVWGHLPPAMREKLLNIYSEKYLPKYDTLIRRYFEALAEQGRESR